MRAHSTSALLLLLGCLLGAAPIGVAAADTPPPSIRRATTAVAREMAGQPELSERGATAPSASAQQQQQQKPRRRSRARVISGAVIGGTVGFFVGGYIGGLIEPGFLPADGDLAALRGIIIGATSGAVLGAILGGKFF